MIFTRYSDSSFCFVFVLSQIFIGCATKSGSSKLPGDQGKTQKIHATALSKPLTEIYQNNVAATLPPFVVFSNGFVNSEHFKKESSVSTIQEYVEKIVLPDIDSKWQDQFPSSSDDFIYLPKPGINRWNSQFFAFGSDSMKLKICLFVAQKGRNVAYYCLYDFNGKTKAIQAPALSNSLNKIYRDNIVNELRALKKGGFDFSSAIKRLATEGNTTELRFLKDAGVRFSKVILMEFAKNSKTRELRALKDAGVDFTSAIKRLAYKNKIPELKELKKAGVDFTKRIKTLLSKIPTPSSFHLPSDTEVAERDKRIAQLTQLNDLGVDFVTAFEEITILDQNHGYVTIPNKNIEALKDTGVDFSSVIETLAKQGKDETLRALKRANIDFAPLIEKLTKDDEFTTLKTLIKSGIDLTKFVEKLIEAKNTTALTTLKKADMDFTKVIVKLAKAKNTTTLITLNKIGVDFTKVIEKLINAGNRTALETLITAGIDFTENIKELIRSIHTNRKNRSIQQNYISTLNYLDVLGVDLSQAFIYALDRMLRHNDITAFKILTKDRSRGSKALKAVIYKFIESNNIQALADLNAADVRFKEVIKELIAQKKTSELEVLQKAGVHFTATIEMLARTNEIHKLTTLKSAKIDFTTAIVSLTEKIIAAKTKTAAIAAVKILISTNIDFTTTINKLEDQGKTNELITLKSAGVKISDAIIESARNIQSTSRIQSAFRGHRIRAKLKELTTLPLVKRRNHIDHHIARSEKVYDVKIQKYPRVALENLKRIGSTDKYNNSYVAVKFARLIPYERFVTTLRNTFIDTLENIMSSPNKSYVILADDGEKSSNWVIAHLHDMMDLYPPVNIITIPELAKFLVDHKYVKHIVMVDDGAYSGSQASQYINALQPPLAADMTFHINIPYMTTFAKNTMQIALSSSNSIRKIPHKCQAHFPKTGQMLTYGELYELGYFGYIKQKRPDIQQIVDIKPETLNDYVSTDSAFADLKKNIVAFKANLFKLKDNEVLAKLASLKIEIASILKVGVSGAQSAALSKINNSLEAATKLVERMGLDQAYSDTALAAYSKHVGNIATSRIGTWMAHKSADGLSTDQDAMNAATKGSKAIEPYKESSGTDSYTSKRQNQITRLLAAMPRGSRITDMAAVDSSLGWLVNHNVRFIKSNRGYFLLGNNYEASVDDDNHKVELIIDGAIIPLGGKNGEYQWQLTGCTTSADTQGNITCWPAVTGKYFIIKDTKGNKVQLRLDATGKLISSHH